MNIPGIQIWEEREGRGQGGEGRRREKRGGEERKGEGKTNERHFLVFSGVLSWGFGF